MRAIDHRQLWARYTSTLMCVCVWGGELRTEGGNVRDKRETSDIQERQRDRRTGTAQLWEPDLEVHVLRPLLHLGLKSY